MSVLSRTLEPEVMDTPEEAFDYDQMDHSAVNERFVTDLLEFVTAQFGLCTIMLDDILDVGTGTAQIPVRLMQMHEDCGLIAACDRSLAMLHLASQNIRNAGLTGRIQPVHCDARHLPVADRSVAVVISNSIIHHIPEPLELFQETRRVVRRRGVVFFRDLLRPRTRAEVDHLVKFRAGNANAHQQQMFRDSLHAALTISEVREIIEHCGFNPDAVRQTSDRHWTFATAT